MEFVCLANSVREGGKCIAGLLLDELGSITKEWVRPITRDGHIPFDEAENIELLSVVKLIEPKKVKEFHWRLEDYYYESMQTVNKSFKIADLKGLENNNSELVCGQFANWNYDAESSSEDSSVKHLSSSLAFCKGKILGIFPKNEKYLIKFLNISKIYTGSRTVKELENCVGKVVFAVISITEKPFKDIHYKLIAEIFPIY